MDEIYDQLEIPESKTPISKKQGKFIHDFLSDKNINQTLEVGFAYGCSAAYIVSTTKKNHIIIDPCQKSNFMGIGIKNLKKLKLDKYINFFQDHSHNVLPGLYKKGIKIDFAFIDGGHKFDEIFVDFFYIDLLLDDKGYVLFDDIWMPSISSVVSWIDSNKKNYKRINVPIESLILFQKIGVDKRDWRHFNNFYSYGGDVKKSIVNPRWEDIKHHIYNIKGRLNNK
ncbi:MAG: class I SAM-dependent methyltransferase [archaeon]